MIFMVRNRSKNHGKTGFQIFPPIQQYQWQVFWVFRGPWPVPRSGLHWQDGARSQRRRSSGTNAWTGDFTVNFFPCEQKTHGRKIGPWNWSKKCGANWYIYIYTLSTVCQNVLSKVVELGSVADRNDLQREADTSPSPEPKEFAFDGVFGESSAMGLAWPSRLAREAKSHLNHWEIAREPSFISYFLLKFWSSQVEFIFSIFFLRVAQVLFSDMGILRLKAQRDVFMQIGLPVLREATCKKELINLWLDLWQFMRIYVNLW